MDRRALETLQAAAPTAELAYHARAAGLAESAFSWYLAAGDEAAQVAAVRDAISFYEQARQMLTERWHGQGLSATLPAPQIEPLYTHLGQAYELHGEQEKARAVYQLLLAYSQNVGIPALERTALTRLATL